ncbi:DUF2264 domain-containing protein [Gordonia alkanivorans]|uniref:DUF2264 domain-containing protein n=1 Tax=Gordonia alkanivorans TaxID=84096 RepID=UPI0034DE2504
MHGKKSDELLDYLGVIQRGAQTYQVGDGVSFRFPGRASRHGRRSDAQESFSRYSLALAFQASARDQARELNEQAHLFERGVENALTGPSQDSRWLAPVDHSHCLIEMPSALFTMHRLVAAGYISDDSRAKRLLEEYARSCVSCEYYDNNWKISQGFASALLCDLSGDRMAARTEIETSLSRSEEWYSSGGWYSDGPGAILDYYNSFSFYYYPMISRLLFGKFSGYDVYLGRLEDYIRTLCGLISGSGRPVIFGRSLAYRSAVAAPLGLYGVIPESDPRLAQKSILAWNRCMNYFMYTDPMVGENGLISSSWPDTARSYSGPGAGYWALKSFAPLLARGELDSVFASALAARDSDEVTPGPVSQYASTGIRVQRSGTSCGAVSRILNHGTHRPQAEASEAPLYAQLEYSSLVSPFSSASLVSNAIYGRWLGLPVVVDTPRLRHADRGTPWIGSTYLGRLNLQLPLRIHRTVMKLTGRRAIRSRLPAVRVDSVAHGQWTVHRISRVQRHKHLDRLTTLRFAGWVAAGSRLDITSHRSHQDSVCCSSVRDGARTRLALLDGGSLDSKEHSEFLRLRKGSPCTLLIGRQSKSKPSSFSIVASSVTPSNSDEEPAPTYNRSSNFITFSDGYKVCVELENDRPSQLESGRC